VNPPSVPKVAAAKPRGRAKPPWSSPRIVDSSDDESDDGDLPPLLRRYEDEDKENLEAPPELPSKGLVRNPYAKKALSTPSSRTIPSVDGRDRVDDDKNSASDIAMMIRQAGDIYKDQAYMDSIRNRAGHGEKHGDNTESLIHRLFTAVGAHSQFGFLADMVVDPEARDTRVRRLYLVCRGTITESKKEILNTALLLFGETCLMKSAGEKPDPTKMSPKEKAAVRIICCSIVSLL
jgi:hypothetical protein